MSQRQRKNPFWLSYADLMTSLFFVMFVLFIACAYKMWGARGELESMLSDANAKRAHLQKILQVNRQFQGLSNSETLQYDAERNVFFVKSLDGIEVFASGSDAIQPQYIPLIDKTGRDLGSLLAILKRDNPHVNYLLVIEGSYLGLSDDDSVTSYDRALALYNRWRKIGINLRKYNTEIQICGRGLGSNGQDAEGRRYVVQIIPKVSKLQ